MAFENEWFNGRQAVKAPPLEAVIDCTRPGGCDEAVSHWVDRLSFDGPAWLIRGFLGDCGAWDDRQLCDHQENLQRLFWIYCGQLQDELGPEFTDYCGDGQEDRDLPATLYLGA